jgi:hypothetical protein
MAHEPSARGAQVSVPRDPIAGPPAAAPSLGRGQRLVLLAALAFGVLVPLAIDLLVILDPIFGDEAFWGTFGFIAAIGALGTSSMTVGVIIRWRRPDNLVGALLIAGATLLIIVSSLWPAYMLTSADAGPIVEALSVLVRWWGPIGILPAIFVLFPSVAIVFPDGRLPGPRWRLPYGAAVIAIVVGVVLQTIAPSADPALPNPFARPGVPDVVGQVGAGLAIGAVLLGFVLAVASIVVRFRRSVGVERAQMKWLIAAVALMGLIFPLSYLTEAGAIVDVVSVLIGCLVPISIGVAILRYRLYDIDRIVSRSLSWTIATGGLLIAFIALVIGLQSLLQGLTQGGTLAVAMSTLVTAALFQPVRRRVQHVVDRRFDRAGYDADRTAIAFAHRLRDEVDLDTLAMELRSTVGHAVRPSATAIWLVSETER